MDKISRGYGLAGILQCIYIMNANEMNALYANILNSLRSNPPLLSHVLSNIIEGVVECLEDDDEEWDGDLDEIIVDAVEGFNSETDSYKSELLVNLSNDLASFNPNA